MGYERKKGIKDDCSESSLTNSFIFTWLASHLLLNNVCYPSWKSPIKHSHTQTINSILRAISISARLHVKHLFLGCLVKINLSSFLRQDQSDDFSTPDSNGLVIYLCVVPFSFLFLVGGLGHHVWDVSTAILLMHHLNCLVVTALSLTNWCETVFASSSGTELQSLSLGMIYAKDYSRL